MQPLRIMTLDLRSPLRYHPSPAAEPFSAPVEGERMARFELDAERAKALEFESADYLGSPALVAEGADDLESSVDDSASSIDEVVIPAGRYLFAQLRSGGGTVKAELLAAAALELQKDGLRRGMALEPHVYLRALAEDGATVFQVLRPIALSDAAETSDS